MAWLAGTVVNGTGSPVAGVTIYVYPMPDAEPPRLVLTSGRGAVTDSRGEFRTEIYFPSAQPVWLHATIIRNNGTDTVRVRGGTVVLSTDPEKRPTVRMTFQLP